MSFNRLTLTLRSILWFLLLAAVFLLRSPTALAQSPDDDDDDGDPDTETVQPQQIHPGSDFYGINFIAPNEPWLTLARESGARVVRWQFNWRDHEPSPGVWDWTAADGPISEWNAAGFKIHAILHNPPDYARANPGWLMPDPAMLQLPWDHSDNGWGHYCNRFAQRYRGQIASYEIWNEPDLNNYWEGTSKDYFYLLRSCYMGIKAADPNVPVSMAGMAILIEPNFLPDVVNFAANDAHARENNHYFDAVSIHMYATPELAYTLTYQARSVLETYGMGYKPIWITEMGVALRGYGNAPKVPQWGYASEDEAAWFLLATVSNALAAGAERVMWFRLADDDMTKSFGLVRNDASLRPSYKALQVASALLYDIVEVSRKVDNGVVITEMRRADGARIISLYSKSGTGRNVTLPAEMPVGVLINATGGYSTIEPNEEGEYTIHIPEAFGRNFEEIYNYSMGGPPLVLLEFDRDPPITTVEAAEIPGDKRHVLVHWRGDDGPFGTGAVSYDVEVSLDDGATWEPWLTGTTETEGVFDVSRGGRFLFRARAVDRLDNQGGFSLHTEFINNLVGTLIAQITDLRGQHVPYARLELSDGSLHDADQSGWLTIDVPPGVARFRGLDGSAHGFLVPEPVEIELGEEARVTWMLLPRENLADNGAFERGLYGWEWSSLHDVAAARCDLEEQGSVLRLSGHRRPWGPPAASTTVDVPPNALGGVLSFRYRLTEVGGQTLRLRAITADGQELLWQTNAFTRDFTRVWVDMAAYAGQRVTLRFELWGPKGAEDGLAEIDDVIYGDVPPLDGGE